MSQYLMNIDSTYRDQKQYPLSTEFGVIVNPTPGDHSAGNICAVQNVIYSRFRWEGTQTTTVPGDTITGNFTDFMASVITLDPTNLSPITNFYVGCVMVLDTGASSIIVSYDPDRNTVLLEDPIPIAYYNPSGTGYRIINPSNNYGNDILLLGNNLFVNFSSNNNNALLFLKSGPTNALFVQNVTAGWVRPIDRVIDGGYRVVLFDAPMPSYTNGDLFQVRSRGDVNAFVTTTASTTASIQDLSVSERGGGYAVGDIVDVESITATAVAQYRVLRIDSSGGILDVTLVTPGAGYNQGMYRLVSGINNSAVALVEAVNDAVEVDGAPPSGANYLFYVPTIEPIGRGMLVSTGSVASFIFFDNPSSLVIAPGEPVELLAYNHVPTGLTMPVVSYKQPVCYDVSLIHLILPNQPVYGFNVLPTFFPYLLVELYNTSTTGSNAGVLYSNNPHTEKVTFYCPIGNPKNPVIVSYLVIVSSTQVQVIKWAPTDNFFFRVLLPNGETLRFNFDDDINESAVIARKDREGEFCFWARTTDRRVSATFSFRLKKVV